MPLSTAEAETFLANWADEESPVACIWRGPTGESAAFRGVIKRPSDKVWLLSSSRVVVDLSDVSAAVGEYEEPREARPEDVDEMTATFLCLIVFTWKEKNEQLSLFQYRSPRT